MKLTRVMKGIKFFDIYLIKGLIVDCNLRLKDAYIQVGWPIYTYIYERR